MCVCMYVCMYASMYVCMYVRMHACMYVSKYVCIHASMYVCMYACMHACFKLGFCKFSWGLCLQFETACVERLDTICIRAFQTSVVVVYVLSEYTCLVSCLLQ